MSDMETIIDKRIHQAVVFHKGSDMCVKYACIAAAQVVGTYSDATEEIARLSRRSVSSVQNWAHAFRLYKELRKIDACVSRSLWRILPASHWWLAYDIQQAGFDALYYLANAATHNWSGRDMLKEFARDREAGNAPLIFRRACLSFRGLADELVKRVNDLTAEQLTAVQAVRKAFEL